MNEREASFFSRHFVSYCYNFDVGLDVRIIARLLLHLNFTTNDLHPLVPSSRVVSTFFAMSCSGLRDPPPTLNTVL